MKAGQMPHATGMRVAEQKRNRRGLGVLSLTIVVAVLNGVPFSQAGAEVYTGTTVHGIRWYSDTAPVQGPYQVVPSSIPRLEAEPPVASTPTNIAVEGDAVATPKRKSKVKASSRQKPSRRKQFRQQPSRQKNAATSAAKSKVKSTSTLASPTSTTAYASRSKSSRSVSPRNTNPRSSRPRKPRRIVMSQRERQAVAQQRRCQRYDLSLRKIHAEMRAGYRAAKGRKLRERRKELQALQFAECPIR